MNLVAAAPFEEPGAQLELSNRLMPQHASVLDMPPPEELSHITAGPTMTNNPHLMDDLLENLSQVMEPRHEREQADMVYDNSMNEEVKEAPAERAPA